MITPSCDASTVDANVVLNGGHGLSPYLDGDWTFHPVYSSYIDLLGVSHGRMPCLHA